MTEERKHAILFAATLLCARKLIELDPDRPSPAEVAAVENAISQVKFILDAIDRKGRSECGCGLCKRSPEVGRSPQDSGLGGRCGFTGLVQHPQRR